MVAGEIPYNNIIANFFWRIGPSVSKPNMSHVGADFCPWPACHLDVSLLIGAVKDYFRL